MINAQNLLKLLKSVWRFSDFSNQRADKFKNVYICAKGAKFSAFASNGRRMLVASMTAHIPDTSFVLTPTDCMNIVNHFSNSQTIALHHENLNLIMYADGLPALTLVTVDEKFSCEQMEKSLISNPESNERVVMNAEDIHLLSHALYETRLPKGVLITRGPRDHISYEAHGDGLSLHFLCVSGGINEL